MDDMVDDFSIYDDMSLIEYVTWKFKLLWGQNDFPILVSKLCDVIFKAATAIVVDCLRPIMEKLILPNHSSFIASRHITNNIVVA